MIDPQMERGDLLAERFGAERPPLICFLLDESGQDIIEYGLAAFLLSLCAVAALNGVSSKVVSLWAGLVTSYSNAM